MEGRQLSLARRLRGILERFRLRASEAAGDAYPADIPAGTPQVRGRLRRRPLIRLRKQHAGHGLLLRRDHSEQAIGIVIGSCSAEELVGLACSSAIAELYGPDLVNLNCLAVRVSQHPKECAGMGIIKRTFSVS